MKPWPITPLGQKDLDFAVVNYDFTGTTASAIGALPPLENAMDTILSDLTTSIADQAVLIASMDGIFDDAAGILNELGVDDFNPVLADLNATAAAGDGLLNDYVTLVQPSGGPPPPPPGTAACDFSSALNDVPLNSTPVTNAIPLSNQSNQDFQITDAKITTNDPDILSATVPTPQTVKPNSNIVGTVTVTPRRVGTFSIQLALTAVGLSRPNVICVEVNVV